MGSREDYSAAGGTRNRKYLVKWKGYPLYESSWQPAKHLENAQEMVREFQRRLEEGQKQQEEHVEEE